MNAKSILRSLLGLALLVTVLVLPFLAPVKRLVEQVEKWAFIGQLAIAVGVTGVALIMAVFMMIRDKRKRDRLATAANSSADEGETA